MARIIRQERNETAKVVDLQDLSREMKRLLTVQVREFVHNIEDSELGLEPNAVLFAPHLQAG